MQGCYAKYMRFRNEKGFTSPKQSEGGQVLILVVMVMVIALTVGLSTALRSVTNFRISTEEENSQRALSAAEAGVEQALRTNLAITDQNLGNNVTIKQVSIVQSPASEFLLSGGTAVAKDAGNTLWLVPHTSDTAVDYSTSWNGALSLHWGSPTDICTSNPDVNTMAAIEVVVISGSLSSSVSNRYVFDPCLGRRSSNNFASTSPGGTVLGKTFQHSASVTVSAGLIGKIIPLYANAVIGVSGGLTPIPAQGKRIESTAASGTTTRKIVFFREYPTLPIEFFSYVLFAPKIQ